MMAGEILTDRELRDQLIRYGLNPGPVVPTTRKLYEKKLMEVLRHQASGGGKPAPPLASSSHAVDGSESANFINSIPGVIRAPEAHHFNGNGMNGHDAASNGHHHEGEFVPPTQQYRDTDYFNGSSSKSQQQAQPPIANLYSQARQDLSNIGSSVLDAGPNSAANDDDDDFTPQSGFIAARVPSQQPTLLGQTAEYGSSRQNKPQLHASQQPTPSYSRAGAAAQQSLSRNPPANYDSQFSSSSTASGASALRDYNVIPSPYGRRPIKRTMHDTFGNSFYLESDKHKNQSPLSRQQTGKESTGTGKSTVDGKVMPAAEHRSAFVPLLKLVMACLLVLLVAAVFYNFRTGMYGASYFDEAKARILGSSGSSGSSSGTIDAENDPIVNLKGRSQILKGKDDDSYLPGA